MGRPIRHLEPGRDWFVTVRCQQAMFLLRPDPACVELVGFWLARALERFDGVRLFAFVQMSNHLHAVLRDESSQLSDFMEYLLGNLAKDSNRLRGRTGAFFERRFSAEPILDLESLRGRILYAVANPVQDALVRTHDEWPGLVAFSGDGRRREFERSRRDDLEAPPDRVMLELAAPPEGADPEALRRAIHEHEAEVFRANGAWCLGARRVLDQDPLGGPAEPRRSRRPLCHASTREAFWGFMEAWRALRAAFHVASQRWRLGDVTAIFPRHTFKPPVRS